jgi:hypothetical protein
MTVTSQQERAVFISRFTNQRFVVQPPRRRFHPTTGEEIENVVGSVIEFRANRFETDDPDQIAFLRARLGPELMELPPGADTPEGLAADAVKIVGQATTQREPLKKDYRCKQCGEAFAEPLALARHTNAKHSRHKDAEPSPADG